MKNTPTKNIARSFLTPLAPPVMALLLCLAVLPAVAEHDDDRRVPDLPSLVCDGLRVPPGNKVSFHAYALGVQIYHWDGTKWVFVAPEAALFSDPCYEEQVGIHYAGPTWENKDGSKVVGARLAGCTPNRGAIPWLLLGAPSTSGHGKFDRVTYIQRVNTIGGTFPAEAGAFVGDEARVPYTAEYYFYRASRHHSE
jgi:hypothetical protein